MFCNLMFCVILCKEYAIHVTFFFTISMLIELSFQVKLSSEATLLCMTCMGNIRLQQKEMDLTKVY